MAALSPFLTNDVPKVDESTFAQYLSAKSSGMSSENPLVIRREGSRLDDPLSRPFPYFLDLS